MCTKLWIKKHFSLGNKLISSVIKYYLEKKQLYRYKELVKVLLRTNNTQNIICYRQRNLYPTLMRLEFKSKAIHGFLWEIGSQR